MFEKLRKIFIPEIKEKPLLNESVVFSRGTAGSYQNLGIESRTAKPTDYVKIMAQVKKCPEAMGIVKAIYTDVLSDGWSFQPVANDKDKGPKAVKKAEEFCKDHFLKEVLKEVLVDWVITGNGYLWMGAVTEKQIKELFKKGIGEAQLKGLPVEMKERLKTTLYSQMVGEIKSDEEITEIRSLSPVASSTMWINFNKTGVLGYYQQKGSEKTATFSTQEILHAKYVPMDGKVYGFSPMISSYPILQTLSLIRDYHGNFFNNGGVPDILFQFPKEMAGSPVLDEFKQTLQQFKSKGQKRGNLVTAGEVVPTPLNDYHKDMEFRELANFYIGVLALTFNMPMSRVATVLGREVKAGNEDLANEGYQMQITEMQDYWETLLNSQLFAPRFGVELKFNRGYKQNEVREVQAYVQKLESASKMKTRGFTDDAIRMYLNVTSEQLPKIEKAEPPMAGGFGQKKPNGEIIPGPNKQILNDKKKKEQLKDKEIDLKLKARELKLIEKKEKLIAETEAKLNG